MNELRNRWGLQDIRSLCGKSFAQQFVFLYIPGFIAFIAVFLNLTPIIGNLIAALAIFAGFLINAIILMFTLLDKVTSITSDEYVNYLYDFVYYAIHSLYSSLIAVTSLVILPAMNYEFDIQGLLFNPYYVISYIGLYFTVHFVITLLRAVDKVRNIFEFNLNLRN